MMQQNALILIIAIPLLTGIVMFFIPEGLRRIKESLAVFSTFIGLILSIYLFKFSFIYKIPWISQGMDFSLRLYHFSAFMILATWVFAFLICLYSTVFMRGKNFLNQFYAYFLIIVAFANGAFLANNLLLLLFFWEGILGLLFCMIAIGGKEAYKAATKAFIISGIGDLCMMLGIVLVGHISGTLVISNINLPLTNGLANLAFILVMIGAISKAGAMPFHSWIPDASVQAPLPFMSLVPAALEKLLGIYLLARISLDMFKLTVNSGMSLLLMIIGGLTIILSVMMALIQKDYKKLLSYHAVSQVGYMVLGIGTALPAGIIGGLFHMINNALYKSGLFLTAGAVEKQTGTTNLEKLGGLARKMPVTFICFIITALAISGVWPFNGFFSKELIYDGALERGLIFYVVAVLGSFFTAASFLKLGHTVFFGKLSEKDSKVREVPFNMLFPMFTISAVCVIFGVFNRIPLNKLILPILNPEVLMHHNFNVFNSNMKLIAISAVVLFLAMLNHFYGVAMKKSALHALDHIRFAPGLSTIYDLAEKGVFDPYNLGLRLVNLLARLSFVVDRRINWAYDFLVARLSTDISSQLKKVHSGNFSVYLSWSLLGFAAIIIILVMKVY
jgi:NADH-quinone oxidoreductase subunit L